MLNEYYMITMKHNAGQESYMNENQTLATSSRHHQWSNLCQKCAILAPTNNCWTKKNEVGPRTWTIRVTTQSETFYLVIYLHTLHYATDDAPLGRVAFICLIQSSPQIPPLR